MPVVALVAAGLGGCGASLTEGTSASSVGLQHVSNDSAAAPGAGAPTGTTTASVAGGASVAAPGTSSTGTSSTNASGTGLAKAAAEVTASATPGNSAYKIGPLDVLDVSVFKVPDLSKTVQVADTGTINLPLVGEVVAAGRTAQEVERDLTKQLGAKYLQSPQVTVFVKEYNSQRVTIEGAVKKPGVYPIRGRTTLLQVIAQAEGTTDLAEDQIVVFREDGGKRQAAKFDMKAIRAGNADDPIVQKGDTVVVGTSSFAYGYQQLLKALPIGSFLAIL